MALCVDHAKFVSPAATIAFELHFHDFAGKASLEPGEDPFERQDGAALDGGARRVLVGCAVVGRGPNRRGKKKRERQKNRERAQHNHFLLRQSILADCS
jgi:hypothetical protein